MGEVDWNATTKTHETPVNKVWVAVEKRAVVICGGVTQLRPAGINSTGQRCRSTAELLFHRGYGLDHDFARGRDAVGLALRPFSARRAGELGRID